MTTTALPRAPRRTYGRGLSRSGLSFVAPFLVLFAFIVIAPLVYSIYLSLFRTQLVGGTSFVGLENYFTAFGDATFWAGLGRVLLLLFIQVPIMLILALAAALAIDSGRLAGRSVFRLSIFIPYAVPGVVAVLLWGFIYSGRYGLAGTANAVLGFNAFEPFSPQWILAAIGNIMTWQFVGYNMIIFYSALRSISPELFEAAAIDGAGQFRILWSIKIPAIRGAVVIASIFSIIGTFQIFTEPNILKNLVPTLISSSFTPNMYAYNLSFIGQQVNYAATIAIIMGIITAVIAYAVQLRGSRKEQQ